MSQIPSVSVKYQAVERPIGHRANLGCVVLQTDETVEHDMRRLVPTDGVALYVSRIQNDSDVTMDTLGAMEAGLVGSASLFPRTIEYDCVGYGCTSASSVIGDARVAELVGQGCPTRDVVTPLSGLLRACQALGVKRLGLVSPYVPSVNEQLKSAISAGGVEVVTEACFYQGVDAKVAQLSPDAVCGAARQVVGLADCDAIFISCTNVRTLELIGPLEAELSLPVLSSNQCMIWGMMRAAKIDDAVAGFGRLLESF